MYPYTHIGPPLMLGCYVPSLVSIFSMQLGLDKLPIQNRLAVGHTEIANCQVSAMGRVALPSLDV